MNDPIAAAAAEMEQVRDQFLRALDRTPDDRLHWTPSPTARTPLRLVAHSAYALGFIKTMLDGTPYPASTMADADENFMEMDGNVQTREEAETLFREKCDAMASYLRSLSLDELDRMVDLPFKLGQAPLHAMLGVGAMHTRGHLTQLEYIQTIYGDRVW